MPSGFQLLSTLTYSVTIKKKEPSPYTNAKQIAALALGANAREVPVKLELRDTAFAAGGVFETAYVPSDVAVSATYSKQDKDTEIGSQTYDNEGRYWYDFSLAVPLATYNDIRYNQSGNTLTASEIKKTNVWAMFNFGLPRDTKKMNYQILPTLLYGVPITGQPLKHHIFAGSVGLNIVNFFVGVRLDQKDFYRDFSLPLTGDNKFRTWRTHLAYGINFPVETIVKALAKK